MRRGKKASTAVKGALPALWRTASAADVSVAAAAAAAATAKEPEAPLLDASQLRSASIARANSQGDLCQPPVSSSKTRRVSVEESRLQPEANQPPPVPPRSPQESSSCGAQASPLQSDKMLNMFRSIPTQMDYKGQKLAEQIFQGIILVSAVIGFIYGFITEQFGWTVYIVMAGFALSCLLTLPPWPIYRRNPLKWLPAQELAVDDKKPADRKVKRHPKN